MNDAQQLASMSELDRDEVELVTNATNEPKTKVTVPVTNAEETSNSSRHSSRHSSPNPEIDTDAQTKLLKKYKSAIGLTAYVENKEHAIVFANLSYSIHKFSRRPPFYKRVQILTDLSGYVPANCLCGIIGASGAGKTTLLGLLAGIPKSGTKQGNVAVSSKKIAFVSQIPHIAATEKVHEILSFSCSVTYTGPINEEEAKSNNKTRTRIIQNRVDTVLETLNLTSVKNRQIRYLSGGELKRVSIAMQLMIYPDILVLDEPTSGLDTPNALTIVQTLRNIVQELNCTVVMSIHQPHKRICDCMDWIISLKDGILLYQGPLPDVFVSRNVLLNQMINILKGKSLDEGDKSHILKVEDVDVITSQQSMHLHDYFDVRLVQNLRNLYNIQLIKDAVINVNDIDQINIDYDALRLLISDIMKDGRNTGNAADYLLETEYLSTTDKLYQHWMTYRDNTHPNFKANIEESLAVNMNFEKKICACDINKFMGCDVCEYLSSFLRCSTYIHALWAFVGLSLRTLRYYYRKWWIVLFNIIVSAAAGLALGSIYGAMTEQQDDIQNRFGAFGFICIFIGIQAIAASGTFHETRDVFIDDRNGKLYGATPFLFARTIPDLILLRVVPSVAFGVILFEMLAFNEDTFGEFVVVIILLSCVSSLCVFAISSLMPDAYIAGFVAIFVNMLFMLYGGVFVQDESAIPEWIRWPKDISFYNFAFEIMMVNEFQGLSFKIDDATVTVGGIPLSFDADDTDVRLSGEFFLGFFGMKTDEVEHDWTMLIVWCYVYFFIAWLALELLYRSKR